MRYTTMKVVGAVLACATTFATTNALPGLSGDAQAESRSRAGAPVAPTSHRSVISVRDSRELPMTKGVTVGVNKSLLIELPRQLRDVVVSDPTILDAVVQSSNRTYLIGKKYGQANAFFFDENGERILTLEVQIDRDTAALDALDRAELQLAGRVVAGVADDAALFHDRFHVGPIVDFVSRNRRNDPIARRWRSIALLEIRGRYHGASRCQRDACK